MKRSLDSIVRRLLNIYWERAERYGKAGELYHEAIWRARLEGMAILFERVDLTGK
jgi:hypothetical protein